MEVVLKQKNPTLRDSTIKLIIQNMKRVSNFGKKNEKGNYEKEGDPETLKDYKKVLKYLKSDDVPISSKKSITGTLITIVESFYPDDKKLKNKYIKYFDKVKGEYEDKKIYEEVPNKEDMITMKDVKEKRDEYKSKVKAKKQPETDYKYLLLSIYSLIPPLRTSELTNTKIGDDDKSGNYINLTEKKMYISQSKTSKKYGVRIIDLPDELIDVIKEHHKKYDNKYLLHKVHDVNKPNESTNISHMLASIFNKKIGVNSLRNVFISEMNDNPEIKAKQRKIIAKQMGHSVGTQQTIYTKYSKTLHD